MTEEPVQILCNFWKDQQAAITYQELREAVIDGAIDNDTLNLWQQDYSVLVATQMSKLWNNAIMHGPAGQPILDKAAFEFNTQSQGILNWIRNRGAEFVTASTQEQKDAIAALLTKKMRDGHTVDELSRLIRPCIGLTEGDAKAATRFYDNIVATLKKEHPRMKTENIRKKALDATSKYAERKHRQRAMTIAQTESAFAYNRGADEGIRQAQSGGYLGAVKKRWCTSGDDMVCDMCASLEGVEVGMDYNFDITGRELFDGQHMLPPAHPRCACAVEYIEISGPVLNAGLSDDIHESDAEFEDTDIQTIYLGAVENVSEDMIKSVLEDYEALIVNSSVENAIIITKDGLMWQCAGDINRVYIDSSINLDGAYVTHNHPIGSANEYSFSDDDINMFIGNNIKLLRGIDEYYVYELSRNLQDLDEHLSIFDVTEYDARHENVISKAKKLGIGYRRWKR